MTKLAKFLVVAAAIAGCNDTSNLVAPPLDRFHYPVGLALRHVPAASCDPAGGPCDSTCVGGTVYGGQLQCRTLLYVASTNFDLSYDPDSGGTLIAVDPDQATHLAPLQPVGNAVRIGSFAGQVALVDQVTCPGWEDGTRPPLALVPSRPLDVLYAMALGSDGAPSCGPGCAVALARGLGDPFGLAVTCRTGAAGLEAEAWVGYLSTQVGASWITRLSLHAPSETAPLVPDAAIALGYAPAYGWAYDPARGRLYITSRFYSPSFVPLRYLDIDFPANLAQPVQLQYAVAGAETTGIALSSDGTRAYVALRLYDPDLALFVRPGDIGGALAVLDLTDVPAGGPSGTLLRLVPMGLGPAEVRSVPRPGMRDLVAVTCTGDSSLYLYDDEIGAVSRVIGTDEITGTPLLGRQPFGLAVESPWRKSAAAPNAVRFFVGSFDQSWVSVVELDDPALPAGADVVRVVDPANPDCGPTTCPAADCPGASCPATCPAACLVPFHIGPERQ